MSLIIWFYHYLNKAVGILNIHYDIASKTYKLYHWPTMIYCVLCNTICIILLQFSTYIYWQLNIYCELLKPIKVMNLLFLVINYVVYIVIIMESWLKRQHLWYILENFKNIFKYYLKPISIYENLDILKQTRNLLLRKFLAAFCEIIVLYLHLFRRLKGLQCVSINYYDFLISSGFFIILDISSILIDINFYMGILFINMFVEILNKNLIKLETEIKIMNYLQRSKNILFYIHKIWLKKLLQDICIISQNDLKLKNLLQDLLIIYQLPLLFLFISYFLSLISLMFFIIHYINDIVHIDPILLIVLLFVLLTNISNIMLLFNICQLLLNSFKKMGQVVYRISVYASSRTGDLIRRDELVLNVGTKTLLLFHYKQDAINSYNILISFSWNVFCYKYNIVILI